MQKPSQYLKTALTKIPPIPDPKQIPKKVINFYHWAVEKKQLSFWIIYAIALYTPYEEFFLKWLPGSKVAAAARLITEVILYGMFFRLIYLKIFRVGTFKRTPIDPLIIAFIISTFVSTIINKATPTSWISYLRILFRYLTVYYIVVNMEFPAAQLATILKGIKIAGLSQGILSSIQYVAPSGFNKIFAPKEIWLGGQAARATMAGSGDLKGGSVAGTFGDSAVLSAFMLIPIIMGVVTAYIGYSGLIPPKGDLLHIFFGYAGLFASKKRAGLMIALLIPIITFWYLRRFRNLIKVSWIATALAGLLAFVLMSGVLQTTTEIDTNVRGEDGESVDLTSYFTQIFSPDYWQQSSENSRGWFIKTAGGYTLAHSPWFGYGPQMVKVQDSLKKYETVPDSQQRIEDSQPFFEDVYWVAFMAFFGLCGLFLYWLLLIRLYMVAKWLIKNGSTPEAKALGMMLCILIIITFIYAFIERILKLRPYSFYFWLFAGLVVNVRNAELAKRQNSQRQLKAKN